MMNVLVYTLSQHIDFIIIEDDGFESDDRFPN